MVLDVQSNLLHSPADKADHKDKKAMVAEKKKHEHDVHEALKEQQKAEKEAHKAEKVDVAKIAKEERACKMKDDDMKHSKRAEHEAHEAAKKAEKEHGETCEHGVTKCRICFPHKHNKELAHGHERAKIDTGIVEDE